MLLTLGNEARIMRVVNSTTAELCITSARPRRLCSYIAQSTGPFNLQVAIFDFEALSRF